MKRFIASILLGLASIAPTAQAQDAMAAARAACAADVQRLCAGVAPGGGRIIACLEQHQQSVSEGCRHAMLGVTTGAQTQTQTQAVPPGPKPASTPPADVEKTPPPASSTPPKPEQHNPQVIADTASGSGKKYFLMKAVQVIDQTVSPSRPAYDLLIPTTWTFKGWVNVGDADGGCFADWFSVYGQANSPDSTVRFQMLPGATWQYVDDPAIRQQLEQQNQRDQQYKMKPCPVRAPIHVADFLRDELIPKVFKKTRTRTIVSIEPDPELDRVARRRLGLSAGSNGARTGDVRIEAARARVAFDEMDGHAAEAWVTAVIVVRTIPSEGHGAYYDWHAVDVMTFVAPKGQLDGNGKLFNLIASTVRPDAKWQSYSNGVIATLYQKKRDEMAKQQTIIAQFQMHVAQTIMGVVANQQAGANRAAYGADKLIRGVQTYQDPASGRTVELSNLYDHAWSNGSNEYVMSDDPNFNPNGALNGDWSALQPVR
jgi:hypothetical protein